MQLFDELSRLGLIVAGAIVVAYLLNKYLSYKGFRVTHIVNITDVGHLTDDADQGEDKVEKRAKELGIQHIYQGIKDKDRVLKELVESLNIEFSNVSAIGDDLNDFNMLKLVGKSFTPNNGVKEIKAIVDTVLLANGGDGAVREMVDILVDSNNQREKFNSVWSVTTN